MFRQYNRREFIKAASLAYSSVMLFPACSLSSSSGYLVFTKDEADCLIALCEQIIPADQDPGATDAGVINFIDRQTHLRFPDEQSVYRQGIMSLQVTCRMLYGKLFEQLDEQDQIEMMKNMEHNRLAGEYWKDVNPSSFFNLVLQRTMQGFYGSPRHGGNKDYISYQMIKLDYPLLIGQNRYKHHEE
jgi:gluconate 2-dehydrogenase gamma chain